MPPHIFIRPRAEKQEWLAKMSNTAPSASAWRGNVRVVGMASGAADREARFRPRAEPFSPNAQQAAALAALKCPWHGHLQRLLFSLGCDAHKFTLYEHQFEAALLCAGIAAPWPTHDLTALDVLKLIASPWNPKSEEQCKARQQALARYLPVATPSAPNGRRSGALLGDVMGLGKTISAISGLLLREYVATLEGREPRSTLIVTPNSLVENQWVDHLSLAGFPRNQVLRFEGDFTAAARNKGKASLRGKRYPRIVLCTKYRLLSEMRGVFKYRSLHSPLMPLTEANTISMLGEMYDSKQQGGRKHDAKQLAKRQAAEAAGRPTPLTSKRRVPTDAGAPARVVAREAESYDEAALPWETVIIDEVHDLRNAFRWARRALRVPPSPFV